MTRTLPLYHAVAAHLACDLDGETAILHIDSGRYYSLNPVASRVWATLQDPISEAAICDLLAQEYDVSPERLGQDIAVFLTRMCDELLVETL